MLNRSKKRFCLAVLIILMIFPVYSEGLQKIAILDFNLDEVTDNEMKIYVYLLTQALYNSGTVVILDTNEQNRIIQEKNLSLNSMDYNRTIAVIGEELSVDSVITGSIIRIENRYAITAKMINTKTSEVVSSTTMVYSNYDDLLINVEDIADILAGRLKDVTIDGQEVLMQESDIEDTNENWISIDEGEAVNESRDEEWKNKEPDGKKRYFGVFIGGPGILGIQLEIDKFYAFVSGSVMLPLLLEEQMYVFGAGIGPSFYINRNKTWKFDLFLSATLDIYEEYFDYWDGDEYQFNSYQSMNLGLGLGFGFHYNNPNGFTLAFKAPFAGAYFNLIDPDTRDEYYYEDDFGMYYLSFLGGIPCVSVGYRF